MTPNLVSPLPTYSNQSTTPFSACLPPHSVHCIDHKTNWDFDQWSYLIPTIMTLAVGAFFLSNVGIGMALGVGSFVTVIVLKKILPKAWLFTENKENTPDNYAIYLNKSLSSHLSSTLGAPLVEEILFRGIVQPFLAHSIILLFPTAAQAVFSPLLTTAMIISILATAILFGLAHFKNQTDYARCQVILSSITGCAYGILAAEFGLQAAIAAHIINNSIVEIWIETLLHRIKNSQAI